MNALIISILILLLPPCPTEDSTMCYWDGGENGQGHSFIALD